ncbi:transcriptional regulator [Streptomyces albipurpureus]|uniref:Transcriptional regulator n=1 Tax=Streptomyces albipurpureus TaxID=2897419 RepID=A0ABT0URX6_9ACTN|nr:transcriptional regulator [Streptomyces sp. CWNU-1]MCM2390143.1 transcriptional regulator [Streptomyces sp. CWNU-1]
MRNPVSVVSPMLIRLTDERATGVLIRDHGALYLIDGQVVHAEAAAAPGLDVLLTSGGRLRPEHWEEAIAEAGTRCQVARQLVINGHLTVGELELCHLATLFDAAFFTLATRSGATRFRYGVTHWLGPIRPVPPGTVERESMRRVRLLNSVWPYAEVDTAPVRRRTRLAGRVISPHRRALLDLADGIRTPSTIARELGRPAFNTLVEVRRLAADGFIDASAGVPPPPGQQPSAAGAQPSKEPSDPAVKESPPAPDSALLRRIREALEAPR